jgi:hypothetical protein
MALARAELLEGEIVHLEKFANSIVRYTDYGLDRTRDLHLGLELMGWGDKEGIGGKLYLTNYRLLFKSHAINRLTGSFSIFLPVVNYARDTSHFIVKRLELGSDVQNYEFVVHKVPKIIAEIEAAKEKLSDKGARAAVVSAMAKPELLASGLEQSDIMEPLMTKGVLKNVGEIVQDPFSISTAINVAELWRILNRKD